MSLTLTKQKSDSLVTPAVLAELRQAMALGRRVSLLCPSFAAALDAQRQLAGEKDLCLGVGVTTLPAWAQERWEVWGDGRRMADAVAREVLSARVVARAAARPGSVLRHNPGTVAVLSDLARVGMPWIRGAVAPEGLTAAEREVAGLVGELSDELAARGMVEPAEAMVLLPERLAAAGAADVALVVVGAERLGRAERECLAGLARHASVSVFAQVGQGPSSAQAEELLEQLATCSEALGVDVEWREDAWERDQVRAPELDAMLDQLFVAGGQPVRPTGAVRLLLPAGPSAEAELVAQEVADLVEKGLVVVASPDAHGLWRSLAPRLAARGVSARAQLSVGVESLEAGRAFMEFAQQVALLAELDATWPEPSAVKGGLRVEPKDMSWWPPRALADFLLSEVSHVPAGSARRLDAEWRANRLLTPGLVLQALQPPKVTSDEVSLATRELLRGRLGSAASKLLAPYVEAGAPASASSAEAQAALAAILGAAKSLKEAGVTADPAVPGHVGLTELVDIARAALARTKVMLRLEQGAGPSCVLVCDPRSAAGMAAGSAASVVLCGQTSTASSVQATDDVSSALLAAFGVDARADAMALARGRFAHIARVPSEHLVLERPLFGPSGKEEYPSVMLTELLSVYGADAGASVPKISAVMGEGNVRSRGESCVSQNASPAGAPARHEATEVPAPAGMVSAAKRASVMPPPEGVAVEDGAPILSASQIETYLECPYKWFSLRRLRLSDADAGFTGAEMGTFAHRVLEVTHRELLARAMEAREGTDLLARMRAGQQDAMQQPEYRAEVARLEALAQADPRVRVAGSDPRDALELAHQILDEEFAAHLEHQHYLLKGNRPLPQALVAHTASDERRVDGLARDLGTVLDYESRLMDGYEPRFFEWSFGRRGREVEYAGVRLTGTVDRIDMDAHGQAAVIDYKHKSDAGFAGEYDAFGTGGADDAMGPDGFVLPRRVQSLIYGQVIRRAFPKLKVTAAVYLCTRGKHELSGAVDAEALENVFGSVGVSGRREPRLAVPRDATFGQVQTSGMDALLDASEKAIGRRIQALLAGDIEARPIDADACSFCPVLNCERRLSK